MINDLAAVLVTAAARGRQLRADPQGVLPDGMPIVGVNRIILSDASSTKSGYWIVSVSLYRVKMSESLCSVAPLGQDGSYLLFVHTIGEPILDKCLKLLYKLSNMKQVDSRGLQHHLGKYLDEVERGETIEVRRRRKIIAKIIPYTGAEPSKSWPDLLKRLEEMFPEGPVKISPADQLYKDRGDR